MSIDYNTITTRPPTPTYLQDWSQTRMLPALPQRRGRRTQNCLAPVPGGSLQGSRMEREDSSPKKSPYIHRHRHAGHIFTHSNARAWARGHVYTLCRNPLMSCVHQCPPLRVCVLVSRLDKNVEQVVWVCKPTCEACR